MTDRPTSILAPLLDDLDPEPGAVIDSCSYCGEPVWYSLEVAAVRETAPDIPLYCPHCWMLISGLATIN